MSYNIRYYRKTKLKASNLIFSYLYNIDKIWMRYLIIIGASIMIAICYWFFLQFSGIYSAGLSSFSQGFSRLSQVLISQNDPVLAKTISNILFWMLFIIFNIPLGIFAYFKVGKNFTLITVTGFVIGDIVGLGLGFIPNSTDIVFIFGNPTSTNQTLIDNGAQILLWSESSDVIRVISLFFYSIFGALILPFFYSIIYILGASTGGTDFVSYYFSIKKHKPLGTMIAIFNTLSLLMGNVIGSYISASLILNQGAQSGMNPWSGQLFFSPNLLVSAIGSILSGVIINIIFPKTKMVEIKIFSKNVFGICDHLIANNYPHTFTISKSIGAYSKKETQVGTSICQFIEVPLILKQIVNYDEKVLISVTLIDKVQGLMNVLEKVD